jgi:hypothetical protein
VIVSGPSPVNVVILPYDDTVGTLSRIDVIVHGSGIVNLELRGRDGVLGACESSVTDNVSVITLKVDKITNSKDIITLVAYSSNNDTISIVAAEFTM